MNKENLVFRDGHIITPFFSSYADRVCIEATGTGEGRPGAELYCITATGDELLYATYPATAEDGLYLCSFFFDPINLQIYEKAVSFRIIFRDFGSISHFSMEEHTDSAQEAAETGSAVFTDDTGEKRVTVLQADRVTQIAVPVIPRHVLFVGNSILLGMSGAYGMCASSPLHDYCYHVQQAILVHNPDCRFSKLYGSMFEHATCREEFEAWWGIDPNGHTGKPAKDSFTDDLDLIILQLGDNVGTQKLANFLECTPILLQRIKALCPRARILWVCGWFNSPLTTPPITRFCEEWKLERVDILSVRSPETQSYSGAPYETADGSVATVKDLWITHPGDLGMQRIADRIIETLSLS
jgi:hypothetical protein